VTTDALPDVDLTVASIEKSKLLGTTDPEQMNKMLDLAKQIYH
jgi:iron(III) transport system substrate-binding protein